MQQFPKMFPILCIADVFSASVMPTVLDTLKVPAELPVCMFLSLSQCRRTLTNGCGPQAKGTRGLYNEDETSDCSIALPVGGLECIP